MERLKFKTPVAMVVTKEQYEKALKEPFKKLGYEISNVYNSNQLDCALGTNIHGTSHLLSQHSLNFRSPDRYHIDHYNPKLFLALAAMTGGEDWIVGEYLCYEKYSKIFKVKSLDGANSDEGMAGLNNKNIYRKATKEELIKEFSKGYVESGLMERLEGNVHKKPQPIVEPSKKESSDNKYVKEIRGEKVDVYDVLTAYDVSCPARAHAIKKLLMAGQRGHKDEAQDLKEAVQAIERSIELVKETKCSITS